MHAATINHGVIGKKPSRREETHATVALGRPKWRRELFQALAVEDRKVHLTEPDIERTPADFRQGALLPRGRRSIYVGGRAIEVLARLVARWSFDVGPARAASDGKGQVRRSPHHRPDVTVAIFCVCERQLKHLIWLEKADVDQLHQDVRPRSPCRKELPLPARYRAFSGHLVGPEST